VIRHLLAAFVVAGFFAATAAAQPYPSRPVRIVIPLPAGSGTDFMARLFADRLQTVMRNPVVVDNRPGGNSIIAAEAVAKAAPDGYTLLLTFNDAVALNTLLFSKLPYNPERDFAPISHVVSQSFFLVAGPKAPYRTLPELIAHARANPGKVSYATSSMMATLLGIMLKTQANVDMLHVPFRGGPPALTAVLSGDVDFSISLVVPYANYVKDGKLFGLATTGVKREFLLPGTPTVGELGHAEIEYSNWNGLFAPAGTPVSIIDSLNVEVRKALSDETFYAKMIATGNYPSASTPEELRSLARTDIERWGKIIRAAGIKLE